MKLINFLNDKRTWAPSDEGAASGDGNDPAPQASEGDGTPPAAPADPPDAPDYSFLPEDVRGDEGLNPEKFREHYEALAAENAQMKEGRESVPQDGKYDFAAPDDLDFGDLELPEGFKADLALDSEEMAPVVGKLSDWMHKHNMPADAAKDAISMLAEMQAIEVSQAHKAAKADFEKLGATPAARNARISQAKRAIEAKLPAEQAKALMGAATSFDGVKALEALFRAPGPGPTVPQINGVDLEKMPPSERLKVINQMKEAG